MEPPMSTKTPNDGSLQTTKQMLDELDALMDRMLSLPVNELEDAPDVAGAAGGAVGEADDPRSRPPRVPRPAELPQKVAAARPASPEPMSEPPPHTPPLNPPHFTPPPGLAEAPLAEAKPSYITPPLPEPEPFTNEVEPPSVMPKLEPMLAALALVGRRRRRFRWRGVTCR